MSVTWDEKVLWPGLQSLYLGLTQNRDGIEWYIGWFFVYRIAFVLPIVYLSDWQYLQIVVNLTFALSTMVIIFHVRPFMYLHNMAHELLNQSFVFMVGMLVYCFTPFMVDPSWRLYVGYFVVVQMIIIVAANLMLMWHSIIWQIFWKMDQEEKVYEAII